ncbi:copper resistance CopC family protein [Flexivirga oryzae]|uniref:CopC domain-containing protein n=1 Tax=Flexivirga oryzae TaxID=1794944 RepID=A0A839ND17_9MICO|nr:copper resistance CopC family protein [Flexivirga oryzae]MBB2893526.1 hypothetical protein [Flexivirga oryzae]
MTLRRVLLAAIAFLVAVCGVIAAAWAHDYLVSSNPTANGTVSAAPKTVTLTFNDIVLSKPAAPQVTVKGPNGRYYETGCGTVSDRVVTTPVALGPAGKYTVTWRIVSADGHPVSDSISFSYQGKATGATGAAAAKQCAATAASTEKSSGGGVPTAAIVALAIIVVVGVGGAAAILLTRGRDRQPDDVDDLDDDEE